MSDDFPPGAWGIVTASLSRIEANVGVQGREIKEQSELLIRLDERQKQSATKADLQSVESTVKAAHRRMDDADAEIADIKTEVTALRAALSDLRLSWAKAGGFAAGGGGMGAAIVVALMKWAGIA